MHVFVSNCVRSSEYGSDCKCVFQGQTPFDVADESVEALLEELLQRQANVRKPTHTLTCFFLIQ